MSNEKLVGTVGINKLISLVKSAVSGHVTISGTVEGEVENYSSSVFNQIKTELSANGAVWLKFSNGDNVRMADWKQSGSAAYVLNFFGYGSGAAPVRYEVTVSASAASVSVYGS